MSATTHQPAPFTFFVVLHQVGLVVAWYAGNTLYNVYNKKATNMIHAHWFVACAQLVAGMMWSFVMWTTGMRKAPNLTAGDIAACVPIGLMACLAHAGSVLAVSFVIPIYAYIPIAPVFYRLYTRRR